VILLLIDVIFLTERGFIMLYLESRKVVFKEKKDEFFNVGFDISSENNFLVGFSDLMYSYSDKKEDHHVQKMFLTISSSIVEKNKIRVSVSADMYDKNQKNRAENCSSSYIIISVFAFSKDEQLSKNKAKALTSFSMSYEDTDHHLQEYGASASLQSCYMQDQHDDHRVSDEIPVRTITLPKNTDISKIKRDDIKSHAVFVDGFAVKKLKSDCHVNITGINVTANHNVVNANFIFKDNGGDQVLADIGSYVKATVLYMTKDNKLAVYSHDFQARKDSAAKLDDVKTEFDKLGTDGIKENWSGQLYSGTDMTGKLWQKSHIQGFASYTDSNKRVFSHSYLGNYGYLIFSYSKKTDYIKIPTLDKGFNHPGGIQAIGDYLLVPCETDDDSHIRLYDMSLIKSDLPPEPCPQFDIYRSAKAACAGITKYKDKFGEWFLLAVCNSGTVKEGTCDFYKAKAEVSLPECKFTKISECPMTTISGPYRENYDVQDINLVTQTMKNVTDDSEELFMVVFATIEVVPYVGTFEDRAVLITIKPKVEEKITEYTKNEYDGIESISFLEDKYCRAKHANPIGTLGVHFRYGAALEVKEDRIVLYATGRNFSGGDVLCNYFVK
jgi:hypothetical protein